MAEPWVDEAELLAAVDALKRVSPEEQEAAILALEESHPGIGDRARALLAIEKQSAEDIRKAEEQGKKWAGEAKKVVEPKPSPKPNLGHKPVIRLVRRPDGEYDTVIEGQAEEAKAEQEKKEPEPEEKQAAAVAKLPAVMPAPPPAELDDVLAAMNRQHAIIENVGGKAVIASWEPSSHDTAKLMVVFQNKDSFLLRYSNRFVPVEVHTPRAGINAVVKVPLGQWWLGHRDRQQYRGVTFRPGGSGVVAGCLNLWQGWGVEGRAGDWGLIRKHIEEVIADGNKVFADYLMRWVAWSIQHPDQQAEVALVLIGLKGVGKGTLVRCLQRIFGAHAFQVTSREEVIGKFNGHLQDCVLFIADEAYWGGDKRCVGRLQGMITEATLPIERKGIDLIQVPNYLHVVMLAEPGWVIPAGRYERRYAALAVNPVRRGDKAYFRALHRQIAEGGAAAMFYDLQRMELDGWHPRDIPEALLCGAALQKQQGFNLPPLEQWYISLLHDGALPMDPTSWSPL